MKVLNSEISLGVQSWCFRDFRGSEALIEQLKLSGLDTIELCFVHCENETFRQKSQWFYSLFSDKSGYSKLVSQENIHYF